MSDEAEITPRTRLYEFAGGLFELQSAGIESDDDSGFYLESFGRDELIGPAEERHG